MIDKNINVHKKSVKRIMNINQELKRVNILDTRYYTKDDKYYPSVTSILQYFPKGKFFETWLKDSGATKFRAATFESAARLYNKAFGTTSKYILVEKDL